MERTPWNAETYLLHVGIKGYEPPAGERPAANLVFLVDVSGSMDQPDKLPLLKAGMKMLTDQLRDDDKVTIVVYAGAAGLVLEPTAGKDKAKIKAALDRLQAGGSTAGGEGLALAYAKAKEAQDRRRHQPHHPGDRRRLQCRRHRYRAAEGHGRGCARRATSR